MPPNYHALAVAVSSRVSISSILLIFLDLQQNEVNGSDKTAYHHAYNFDGKHRQSRPDSLFLFRRCLPNRDRKPSNFLEWAGKTVLDYRGMPILDYDLPATISSKVQESRLEAMRRSNSNIELADILARILAPGLTDAQIRKTKNKFSNAERRWRNLARLIAFKPRKGADILRTYLRSVMTAEMIAKNTTRGLIDVVARSDEARYMKLLSRGSGHANSRKNASSEVQTELEETRVWKGAYQWAQKQITKDAYTEIATSPTRAPLAADSIESIVAWKLASLIQQCENTQVVYPTSSTLPNSQPAFPLGDDYIDAFFGGDDRQTDDPNDPYGLLGRPAVSNAHTCLVGCILQAACDQFTTFFSYPPKLDDSQTYLQQLKELQDTFTDCWTKAGSQGDAPLLYGVIQLDRTTMRWNSPSIPNLTAVEEYKERSIETLVTWQRKWAKMQRKRLALQPDDQDEEDVEVVSNKEGEDGGGEEGEESGGEGIGGSAEEEEEEEGEGEGEEQ